MTTPPHSQTSPDEPAPEPARSRSISCIIPTHRRDDLLRCALDSVAAQDRRPDELIVSDDTGSESTRAVVDTHHVSQQIPVTYLDSSDSGFRTAGASRNAGARAASGDVLAFLDDDDLWEPGYLARMAEKLGSSGTDFVVSWAHQRKGDFTIVRFAMKEGITLPRAIYPTPGMTGSNFVITRTAYDKVGGFDPALRVANDADMCARLLREGMEYAVVREPLVSQIGHPGEHLSSRGTRRAKALEDYRAKWSAELTPAQHRDLTRVIHAALRGRDQPLPKRLWHTALQAWHTSPRGFVDTIRLRLMGRPDMFNG